MAGPYEGFRLRKIEFPEPVAVMGWWRRRWTFEAASGTLRPTSVPPPCWEIDPSPAVVTSSWDDDGRITVDCYTRDEMIAGDALALVSVVAAWIKYKNGGSEIVVDGEREHPILRMSHLDERLIADLTALGY